MLMETNDPMAGWQRSVSWYSNNAGVLSHRDCSVRTQTLAKRQCEAHLEGAARKKAREKPLDTKTKLPSPGGNASSPIAKPTSPARSGAAGGGGQTPAKQRREKKEYGKIGQTRDTPEEVTGVSLGGPVTCSGLFCDSLRVRNWR